MSEESPGPDPDDQTLAMFDDAEMGGGAYQVLARKYRPRRFEDLIGQEAMVRTLTNAFATGRIAHAFMLTGVRGVGKTTTARLLARALNYVTDDTDAPSITLEPPGEHCEAIMEGRHPDVLELDAASRTGVADMRELLDGARYAAVSARYKVYIIDEVHMLSTAAFNALLKTLEEPPAHVKFIFATTEIRKVPVTVLSRCQRFDLRRLSPDALAAHLGAVAKAEGADVSEEGLALIARAAEGSVRDGLSILDQAIVQTDAGTPVSADAVREMLGLADRARLLDVFELAIAGEAQKMLADLTDQLEAGADPLVFLKDMLDIAADVASAQVAGDDYTPGGPADWVSRTRALAQRMTGAQAARYWQILLAGYRDTQVAPDAPTAVRMVMLRVAAAAGLPSPEDAARLLAEGGSAASPGKGMPAPEVPGDGPTSLEELVGLLETRREAILAGEVESFLRPAAFRPGHIACALETGAPPDLLRRLATFLERETGMAWTLAEAETGSETMKARAARVREEKITEAARDPGVQRLLEAFPGAEIVEVRQEAPLEAGEAGDNVVPMDRPRKTSSGTGKR